MDSRLEDEQKRVGECLHCGRLMQPVAWYNSMAFAFEERICFEWGCDTLPNCRTFGMDRQFVETIFDNDDMPSKDVLEKLGFIVLDSEIL